MENLFDWTSEIKAGIILEPGTTYYIECGNSFDEFVIREAFDKIFGWDKVNYCLTIEPNMPNKYINIFNNQYISRSMKNGGQITFNIRYDDKFIYTGWDDGSYYMGWDNNSFRKFISMEDFINYCIIEKG